ncbi:MAG TPA: hypothetical protein VN597_11845 [Streptosporangiaceae bacterium]|jgi:hypothetical protein|nr:hypothetical protein [Streptosporangiaceae bacterium]
MTGRLLVGPRYCGPPGTGNGGYVSGLIAGFLDGPAEVTLRRPPPLGTPLAVQRDGDQAIRVLDGPTLVAEAARVPDHLAVELPAPVSVQDARRAGRGSRLRTHPDEHPFPRCFVCGPDREPGDGLRIHVGRVAGRELSADAWCPGESLAGPDGQVRAEFLWAALDCPGGIGAFGDGSLDGPPFVLGRFAVRQTGAVRAGEAHAVAGWRVAQDGRKMLAGSALFTAGGQAVAVARATWIRLG